MALKFTTPVTPPTPAQALDAGVVNWNFQASYQRDSDGKLDPVKEQTTFSAQVQLYDATGNVVAPPAGVTPYASGNWRDLPSTLRQKIKATSGEVLAWMIATGRLPAGAEEGDL